jgi:hypothetical protein
MHLNNATNELKFIEIIQEIAFVPSALITCGMYDHESIVDATIWHKYGHITVLRTVMSV